MSPPRLPIVVFALLVALSLVAAPMTMGDWGEQAAFSVEPIDQSQVRDDVPVIQYESLDRPAQEAVKSAIKSPNRISVVYGTEDWPDRFFYSDHVSPGNGMYVVVYEGQHYRLMTSAGGGFAFVYWLFELPFILYGVLLGIVAVAGFRRAFQEHTVAAAAVPGFVFHLLGPEFDFPLLGPVQYIGLGVLATLGLLAVLAWSLVRSKLTGEAAR